MSQRRKLHGIHVNNKYNAKYSESVPDGDVGITGGSRSVCRADRETLNTAEQPSHFSPPSLCNYYSANLK